MTDTIADGRKVCNHSTHLPSGKCLGCGEQHQPLPDYQPGDDEKYFAEDNTPNASMPAELVERVERPDRQDVLNFLGHAFRNIDLPKLSPDDLGDIADGLRSYARAAIAALPPLDAEKAELREALEPFAEKAEYADALEHDDADYVECAPFTASAYRKARAALKAGTSW